VIDDGDVLTEVHAARPRPGGVQVESRAHGGAGIAGAGAVGCGLLQLPNLGPIRESLDRTIALE
jgi:hypothetical protein